MKTSCSQAPPANLIARSLTPAATFQWTCVYGFGLCASCAAPPGAVLGCDEQSSPPNRPHLASCSQPPIVSRFSQANHPRVPIATAAKPQGLNSRTDAGVPTVSPSTATTGGGTNACA